MSNNNEKDDKLTVSRVYDTLKSPNFLKSLYWDILSDIKEKNTYKFIRELAEGVIDQNMEVLKGLNNNNSINEADDVRKQGIVSEISVMSYTIDKIFSKILYLKLEKACKEQIIKIIQELKDEGKISENIWTKFKLNADTLDSQTSIQKTIANGTSEQPKKDIQKVPTRVGKRRRKPVSNYICHDIKKTNSNKEILDDLKKVNSMKYTNENKDNGRHKKENFEKKLLGDCRTAITNVNAPNSDPGSSKRKLSEENVSVLQNSIEKKPEYNTDSIDNSDNESEISFGCMSVASDVSSVHTSDLSSFDDEITLSSDDENGEKKKMSLKEVVQRFSGKFLPDYSAEKKNAKSLKSSDSKVSVNNATKNVMQGTSFELPSENALPKRARKPNSKYSSDNILCPAVKVKERKKSIAPTKTIEKNIPSDESLPQKKAKVEDDIYVDVVTITESIKEESNSSIMKTPANQPESSELFKSSSASRSLTSRRTAPLTLFST